MKTLLLADVPPSSNYTGGIVTAQMCRFVPEGELAIFCVQNMDLSPQPYPDLKYIPTTIVAKPSERPRRGGDGQRVGPVSAWAAETATRMSKIPALVRQAVDYGLAHGVTSVWVILEGQTIVRMAQAVAKRLAVPLRTQVWDPLSWWLDMHQVDAMNRRLDLALFDRTVRASTACAVASWEMATQYSDRYGVASIPVISSLDRGLACHPEPCLRRSDEVVIGMAGQLYAKEEWLLLVRALTAAEWRLGKRRVRLCVFGQEDPRPDVPAEHVDFQGWVPQEDVVGRLSQACDVFYCPYPFAPGMEEVSRFSFPSKIVTYLAAGRPILFHGPAYSSPAAYLRRTGAGVVSARDPKAVHDTLVQLCEDTALYQRLALAARQAFLADFTLEDMRASVRRFLGYDT